MCVTREIVTTCHLLVKYNIKSIHLVVVLAHKFVRGRIPNKHLSSCFLRCMGPWTYLSFASSTFTTSSSSNTGGFCANLKQSIMFSLIFAINVWLHPYRLIAVLISPDIIIGISSFQFKCRRCRAWVVGLNCSRPTTIHTFGSHWNWQQAQQPELDAFPMLPQQYYGVKVDCSMI